ncbi:hypothetical protein GCM10009676_33720 [Prauserella halophila]|uniref:Uncharacterized protein n=1 Tax=Prauserella halophila TaxID=185641 RepID=A0ABN1WG21_9PSEU|nr:hypothetical protein [Prauserella halophila]MCP2238451.1 hypothetical protein [Prauserella halophila]
MTTTPARLFVTWFRSGTDGRDHAVTDEANALAHQRCDDAAAVCGHRVTPVPLTVPPGPRCHACQRYLHARTALPDFDQRTDPPPRRRRTPTFLRRLVPKSPARSVAAQALPRTDRAGPDHGGSAETPTSGGAAVHHPEE